MDPLFEGCRIQGRQHLAEGVVGRDAVGQIQKGAKPRLMGFTVVCDLGPMFQAADHGTDRDDQDVVEFMGDLADHSRVGNVTK